MAAISDALRALATTLLARAVEDPQRTQWAWDRTAFVLKPAKKLAVEIETLSEFTSATDAIARDPAVVPEGGKDIRVGPFGFRIDPGAIVRRFAAEVLMSDELRSAELANDVERNLVGDRVDVITSAPLIRFRCERARIDFGEGFVIERMTAAEANAFASMLIEGGAATRLGNERTHIARFVDPLRKQTTSDAAYHEAALSSVEELVHFLRFFKKGYLSAPWYVTQLARPFASGSVSGGLSPMRGGPGTTDVKEVETDDLVMLWKAYRGHPRRRSLRVAIRRLGVSQEAHRSDDRIMDLVIGLEALLLSDLQGPRDELSFRAALRAAHLLARHRPKQSTFAELRKAYATRSTIAHGGELKLSMREAYEFAEATEALLRLGIRELLTNAVFRDASATPWDDLILG